MKEKVCMFMGEPYLRVFPYLASDADDRAMSGAGSVEATSYYEDESTVKSIWQKEPHGRRFVARCATVAMAKRLTAFLNSELHSK